MAPKKDTPLLIELGNTAPHQAEQGLYQTHRIAGGEEHFHSYGDETGSGRRLAHAADVTVTRNLHPALSHTTVVDVPAGKSLDELIADLQHLWPHHSTEAPGWVGCADADVKAAVEEAFGIKLPDGPTALYLNGGRDWVSQQVLGAAVAAATNQGKYIALTANTASPAATDTTLTGEITTASGGLIRAAGTVAHTTGASSSTVSNTFTANGSDSLPVTIAKAGLLNAASTGTMLFETLFTTTATLTAVGDNVALTWTVSH